MVPNRPFAMIPSTLAGRADGLSIALYYALALNSDLLTGEGQASREQLMRDAGFSSPAAFYRRRQTLESLGLVVWRKPNGRATRWLLPWVASSHPDRSHPNNQSGASKQAVRSDAVATREGDERGVEPPPPSGQNPTERVAHLAATAGDDPGARKAILAALGSRRTRTDR